MAKTVLHTSQSRGSTNTGSFLSRHTFSFGDYYNPEHIHFGELRVINDNMLAPGKGLGMHPHSNMEIITLPLEGELEYKDDQNNTSVVGKGEIHVLSAGAGIFHSEMNKSKDSTVKFLQLWLVPKAQKVKPRYEQQFYETKENELTEILSPDLEDNHLWIYQEVWMYKGKAKAGAELDYFLKNQVKNGVYVFVIDGQLEANEQLLNPRDGYGLWELAEVHFTAQSDCEFLVIEVPMK